MAAQKNARTRAPKVANTVESIVPTGTYSVDDMAKIRANVRGIDVGRAAKDVRGRLRANFADVVKLDPNVAKVKSAANDGNRWPAMNGKVAALVLKPRGS